VLLSLGIVRATAHRRDKKETVMKRKCFKWPLDVKLEAIRARQRGVTRREVSELTGISGAVIDRCMRAFKKNGVAGLEGGPRREGAARKRE